MRSWSTKHWLVLAGMLVSLGAQLGGVEHGWTDVFTPGFIGGVIGMIGTTLAALFMDAPRDPDTRERREDSQTVSASTLAQINKE